MTIRRRIAARQFPAVRNGRKSMIPRSFVERLLAEAEAGRTVVVEEAVEEWRGSDRGSSALRPLAGFALFLVWGSVTLRIPVVGFCLVAAVMVGIAVSFIVRTVRLDKQLNRALADAHRASMLPAARYEAEDYETSDGWRS